jgi:predicted AlkP superfamily pyrophosphatase or phosphodiesterase
VKPRNLIPLLLFVSALGCADAYPALQVGDPAPLATLSAAPQKARAERVILVSIDGCRPDAFEPAGAETIKMLIARGAYCATAQTIRPSITLPSHTAMLTGLDFARHGVVWNNYRTGYIVHPTVFSVVTQVGKKSAMLFSKDKFHFLANPACVSWIYGPPTPNKVPKSEDFSDLEQLKEMLKKEEESAKLPPKKPTTLTPGEMMTTADMLTRAFNASWPQQKWALTFIHFREPDEFGHKKGWMGPEYLEGLKSVDKALAGIVETIEKNGGFEKTALIITADHGGSGRGHYRWLEPNKPENVTIPWICVGPGVPAGLQIDRVIHTYDTAPTALAFLGLGAPEGIDGKAVEEVLR